MTDPHAPASRRIANAFANLGVITLSICAVAVSAKVLWPTPNDRTSQEGVVQGRLVEGWERLADSHLSVGPATAPVTIVVFADFQCSACRVWETRLAALLSETPERVRLVYRQFPLSSHPHAATAAIAAECANAQGTFPRLRRAMFDNQALIGDVPWDFFAREAEVPDVPQFGRCLLDADGDIGRAIARDKRMGEEIGVVATPTWIVNGRLYVGALPLRQVSAVIQDAEAASRSVGG